MEDVLERLMTMEGDRIRFVWLGQAAELGQSQAAVIPKPPEHPLAVIRGRKRLTGKFRRVRTAEPDEESGILAAISFIARCR